MLVLPLYRERLWKVRLSPLTGRGHIRTLLTLLFPHKNKSAQEPGKLGYRLDSDCSTKLSHSRTHLIKNCIAHTCSAAHKLAGTQEDPKLGLKICSHCLKVMLLNLRTVSHGD